MTLDEQFGTDFSDHLVARLGRCLLITGSFACKICFKGMHNGC